MPLTPDMRRSIDQIRDYLFGGGYPDPVSNAEQLSFLFFFYLVEGIDAENKLKAKVLKQPYKSLFAGDWQVRNPLNSAVRPEPVEGRIARDASNHAATVLRTGTDANDQTIPRDRFRWSVWAKALSGEALVRFVRDEVFAFFAELGEQAAHNFMDGARLAIIDPTVLTQVINLVDGLRLDQADADTKGDLFEHVLRQIKQAGELGQFRTPRHVIRVIVDIIDPKIGETIYDPAAGTAGFLVAAYNHIRLANSSPSAIQEVEMDGKKQRRGLGDKLSAAQTSALQSTTFFGNDVDPKMVRLATMNLTLRGLANVRIRLRNVLTTNLDEEHKTQLGLPREGYHVVLANPPFAGRVDKDRVVEEVKVGTSTATELLFLKYMMDNLRQPTNARTGAGGGRCGVIVPEGVLFGSTTAHKELRRQLIENNRVDAVLSLPGGVFQPYAGVKTSVIFFRKGGSTENVLFLHADNDGYKLDANHDTPIEADDLPALIEVFKSREARLKEWNRRPASADSCEKWWFADTAAIRTNDFNLSAGRYRPMSQAAVEHRDPREILDELAAIEAEIAEEVEALRIALVEQAA
jgi:type I restriction enzyme M protein